jgi:hypothetical protein
MKQRMGMAARLAIWPRVAVEGIYIFASRARRMASTTLPRWAAVGEAILGSTAPGTAMAVVRLPVAADQKVSARGHAGDGVHASAV